MSDRLLTPHQVADLLGLQPRTVQLWLRSGRLPGIKLGRLWRVRASELDTLGGSTCVDQGREARQKKAMVRLKALGV